MTVTYSIDGVPLDHPAGCWRLQASSGRRPLPGVRAAEVTVPGRAGQLPVANLDHQATTLGLTLLVEAIRTDGTGGTAVDLEANLEALAAVTGVRHRLLDLRHHVDGVTRRADAQMIAASEPELLTPLAARLALVLTIPGVYWRDIDISIWTGAPNTPGQRVFILDGCTAPVTDAVLRVTGPAERPAITDEVSSGTVAWTGTLTGGQRLLVDTAAMAAAVVETDTWDLADGEDVTGQIEATGPGSASRWLHLTPAVTGSDPFARYVTVTAAANGTGEEGILQIRARRAYL